MENIIFKRSQTQMKPLQCIPNPFLIKLNVLALLIYAKKKAKSNK